MAAEHDAGTSTSIDAQAGAGQTEATKPVEIFYSYSHKDGELRDELENHLKLLQRQGYITFWHDRMIGPGSNWRSQIDEHLNSADIILLLISADFLASDYCYDIEMKRALERHKAGEVIVIPIIRHALPAPPLQPPARRRAHRASHASRAHKSPGNRQRTRRPPPRPRTGRLLHRPDLLRPERLLATLPQTA